MCDDIRGMLCGGVQFTMEGLSSVLCHIDYRAVKL
jgi:hypothetical protein